MTDRRLAALSAFVLLLASACADSAQQAPAAQAVDVTIQPPSATVPAAGVQQFAAQVVGAVSTAVTWQVVEGATGGSVATGGLYTAPQAGGIFHVRATSVADPTKSATATVTVPAPVVPVAVSILPGSGAVNACQTLAFAATVTNATNTAVTWSVLEGATGGTIASNGTYTAPNADGTYHVIATSVADPTKSASVPVTVTSRVVSVAVSPATVTVPTGGTATFTASVTTTCGTVASQKTIDDQGRVVAN